jgi:hypothetical protein
MHPPPVVPVSRPRSRAWVGYVMVLVLLSAVAATIPIVYNLGQQLRPENLETARQRWREHGPSDYDLTFAIRYDRERLPERHIVIVRGGKVVLAACEGEIQTLSPALQATAGMPAGGLCKDKGQDVPAILDHIADLLHEPDANRNFLVAAFDLADGHPRRIIRRVRASSTREEWNLRLWPADTLQRGEVHPATQER